MPYWISATLAALPSLLWMFFGLGVPYTLAILPRKDWRDRPMVICLSLAFGAAIVTAWMFILGTLGARDGSQLLRFDLIFGGTVVLALIGGLLAWRKYHLTRNEMLPNTDISPLRIDEKLIIALIIIALIIRWFTTAYWPFTAYDELWVFGYEGKLYALLSHIPNTIGYYPQYLPLQYTYAQLAIGHVDDHAARAVIPFLHIGSILAVYMLGSRVFNRRIGIFASGLWALYPHVGEWAHVGDLEITQTFLVTAMAAFFFMAWTGQEPRRRYALIAGLLYGIALWTKPTAGAFVWGVILLVVVELLRHFIRQTDFLTLSERIIATWNAAWPRFEVALITGLACIPLGGVWYVRNFLLGHEPIVLPNDFWLELAQRSGLEFGWPLLAILVFLAYLFFNKPSSHQKSQGRDVQLNILAPYKYEILGLLLILAGILPSIISPHRMGLLEWAALGAGAILLAAFLRTYEWSPKQRVMAAKIGWILALALPYFVTWFYSYSYHYRLSFAIVPLMLMPTAVILGYWLTPERLNTLRRFTYLGAIALISIPGLISTLHDFGGGWDWLWSGEYPDDFARYASENPSLMIAGASLQDYINATGQQPIIIAPGSQLLPFFFPLAEIRNTELPTELEQLAGATHYIYSWHAQGAYQAAGIPPEQNRVVPSLGRAEMFRPVIAHNDGNFFYEVYEIQPRITERFVPQEPGIVPEGEVVFGDFARFVGANIHAQVFSGDQKILFEMVWESLNPAPDDYMIYVHFINKDDGSLQATWDAPVGLTIHGYYSTRLWETGEYITDSRFLQMMNPDAPAGQNYRIVIGFYSLADNQRVPLTIDGEPAGDGYEIPFDFRVAPR